MPPVDGFLSMNILILNEIKKGIVFIPRGRNGHGN